MALADELAADMAANKFTQCRLCTFMETAPDREEFEAAFRSDLFTSASLSRALNRRGGKFSNETVLRHRRKHT